MSQANIRAIRILYAPEGAPSGGGGGAPAAAAPAAPAAASTAPASAPAASDTAAKQESAAKERSEGLPEPRPRSPEDKKRIVNDLKAHLDAKRKADDGDDDDSAPAPKPKPRESEKPAEREHADKAAPRERSEAEKPAQPPQEPAQDKGERDRDLSRTTRERDEAKRNADTHERNARAMYQELKTLKEAAEKRKTMSPLDALEELGYSYEKLTQEIVERKLLPRAQRNELPPEIRQELDGLKQWRQQQEQAAQTQEQQRTREQATTAIKGHIENNAEQFPLVASLGWGAQAVVNNTLSAKQTDMLPHLVELERSLTETLGSLGNERALTKLLTSKPDSAKVMVAVLQKLGHLTASDEAAVPASKRADNTDDSDGPSSVSSVPTGRAAAPKTRRELKAEAVRGLRDLNARRRESGDDD